jgi:UDP-N-acetylmuramoylalanine--D-glutamate ligase
MNQTRRVRSSSSFVIPPSPFEPVEVEGKKVLVVGAARSGVAAARFLAARGALVVLNDRKDFIDWSDEALALKSAGVVKLLAGDPPSSDNS